MIQSIYFISGDTGDVLLEKHYKGIVSRAAVETFWEEVSKRSRRDDVPPILLSTKFYLCSIYRDNVYVLALMTGEVSAAGGYARWPPPPPMPPTPLRPRRTAAVSRNITSCAGAERRAASLTRR